MSTSPSKNAQKPSSSSSVHQKLSLLTTSSSTSSSKPFIKNKSQTTASIVFPSFRFSPESEEIEEIVAGDVDEGRRASFGGGDGDRSSPPPQQSSSENTPSTSKQGGDISPLKEYILKHKWANKWDKRSLSLDLDLKGKIITAIEDKRRSFVSHFYNEEDEAAAEILREVDPLNPTLITSSCSIPEQLTTSSSLLDQEAEDISVHSDSLLNRGNKSRDFGKLNFDEENNSDYFDEFELSPESSSLPNTPMTNLLPDDLRDLIVEEIGVDCCEDIGMVGEDGKVNLSLLREFVLPPDAVQERFQGMPTLYNPPSVVRGLRKFPLQEVVSKPGSEEDLESQSEEEIYKPEDGIKKKDLTLTAVIRSLLRDIVYHPWVIYWIGFLAILIMLDLGGFVEKLICFGLGVTGAMIVYQAIWKEEDDGGSSRGSSDVSIPDVSSVRVVDNGNGMLTGSYWKSQGWMLTLPPIETTIPYPNYDAFTFHLRNTKTVFIRLDGPSLLISHPHPKHRIPKRRLWNDPLITSEMIFIRHQHYNLYGAKVEIVPSGLAKKRVWCKKYPIAITLTCRERYLGKLMTGSGGDRSPSERNGEKEDPGSVSFTKDEKGKESVKVGREDVLRGEVYKEESCAGKTIFLFARTDREKDDWFRRLVSASKYHSTQQTTQGVPRNSPDFSNFVSYMKRACPTLYIPSTIPNPTTATPRSTTPTNELYDTVLIPNMNPPLHSNTNSPSNSRKSTPDKEHIIAPPIELLTPSFLNALMARVFYDFLRSPKWTHEVKLMIDRKLFFLRKPKVVESLKVKELDLGDSLPVINHASSPVLDKQGLWVDLDISFTGNVVITIEAFLNLFNMGRTSETELRQESPHHPRRSPSKSPSSRTHAMFDSDADDSGESSESEDELELEMEAEKLAREGSLDNRGKMFKYADAIAKSSVMRNKHVQKVVGNIAATPFVLSVEIKRVVGSVALNIPPVPNDRVWIGFRSNPVIDINARPKVGERVVSLSQITGWIKRKLLLEFQRVMVCPNMMDVTINLMEFELPK